MARGGERTAGVLWCLPALWRPRRRLQRPPPTPRKRCRERRSASTSAPRTLRVLQTPQPPARFMKGVPGAAEAAGLSPGGLIRFTIASQPSAHGKNARAEAVPPPQHRPRWHTATVSWWR